MQDFPEPDKIVLDVVSNIKADGICRHFLDIFQRGEGLSQTT